MSEMRVFAPGPAQIDNEIRDILSKQVVYHRTEYFLNIWRETHSNLKQVFQTTKGQVLINNGSGTGGMDSAVLNLINEGEKVLVINTGFFGERFTQINHKYNNKVIELTYPWGDTYNIDEVKQVIDDTPDLKAIFVTHCDTSNGILNKLKPLGELLKDSDTLLIVDSISGIVMNDLKFDEWHLDCVISASQKGFMLPPGLNMVCLSPKAINKIENNIVKSYYNNYLDQLSYLENDILFCTVNTPLICALHKVSERLINNGVLHYNNYYAQLYSFLKRELKELGFTLYLKKNHSNSLIIFLPPKGVNSNLLATYLQEHNIIIGIGFGRLEGQINRIGIMNAITLQDCSGIINLIKEYLCHMDM